MDDESDNDNLVLIEGKKTRKRPKKPKPKKQRKKNTTIQNFWNRPMYDMTIGDAIVMSACTTVVSVAISLGMHGVMFFLESKSKAYIQKHEVRGDS
jgi:hypothetical protein